jgi:drug efflux transport system permease protein
MSTRLRAAIRKEFMQFLRDRMVVALILYLHTAEVMLCAYALSFDVQNLRLAVLDREHTQLSGQLVERFTATPYFGTLEMLASRTEADRALDAGRADLVLVVPPDFTAAAVEGRPQSVQILLSGVNSNTASAARGYAQAIVERFAHDVLERRLAAQGFQRPLPQVTLQPRIWYNPELRFRYFMVISMIVAATLLVGVVTSAASMVREKETGTAEQLMITPLRRGEVVLAKMLPPFAIGMAATVPSLGIIWWFGLPFRGSIALFLFASALALLVCLVIGIIISTFAQTLQQALLIAFFVLFPLMFLSGTIVPIDTMPAAMQYLSLVSPIRYYMEIALGVVLKGVGVGTLWPQFLGLAGIGGALVVLGLPRLRNRLYA